MKIVDSYKLHVVCKSKRVNEVCECPYIAIDGIELMESSYFCLHPNEGNPEEKGFYAVCHYVCEGDCPYSIWKPTQD